MAVGTVAVAGLPDGVVAPGFAADYSETIPATGHNWGEWYVANAPTTEYEGTEMRECLNPQCDALHTRSIAKLPPEETATSATDASPGE